MRALVLDGGSARVADLPSAPLPPGEARVRVLLAGICATDLELRRGYLGFRGVPGHEFVGEVIEGPAEWRGARVVGEINAACGACPTCRAGRRRHCPRRTVLGIVGRPGSHAEEVLLPAENLHRVPSGLPDEAAVFVEPLAAAWHVCEQVNVAGRAVAVLGAGRLGQLLARSARLAGGDVLAIGRDRRKLDLLRAAGIATATPQDVQGRRFPVVVEATGTPEGFALALSLTEPTGSLVLKTTTHGATPVDLAPVVVDEVTVVGSRCGRFEPALALLAAGAVDPRPLVDAVLPLEEAAGAYERSARPGALKVLLRPGG
jgi:alcohol dehydrogenase